MTAWNAVQSLSAVDERYLADADVTPVRRFPLKRVIAAASCLVLLCAAIGGFFAWRSASEPRLITSAALRKDADTTLITSYPMTIEASYTSPRNGDVLLFLELQQALKHYENENVQFWVQLTVHSDDGEINFSEAEADVEAQRLAALDYDVYTYKKNWTGYWGEEKHYTTICLKMTADELNAFEKVAADERYGYAFDFAPDETAPDAAISAADERYGYEAEPITEDATDETAAEHDGHEVETAPDAADGAVDDRYGYEVDPITEDATDSAAVAEK